MAYKNLLMLVVLLPLLAACNGNTSFGTFGKPAEKPTYNPLSSRLAEQADPQSPTDTKPLHCQLGQGTARFDKVFAEYQTVRFDLYETSRANITLTSKKGAQISLQGIFDHPGQKIIFCPVRTGAPDQTIACNSFYALDEDLNMGIRRTFDIPDAVTGSTITCGYDWNHLPPLS